ncbi:MAG: YceI family protein [Flavobacteriales bacterium]|nr:YceI family protein [Flavobacteriales bacterium]
MKPGLLHLFTACLALVWCSRGLAQDRVLLRLVRSEVTFVSNAPLERITATNTKCSGLLDPVARTFAVQVPIAEFQGFNSPLQREHFNENYLEQGTWPDASFAGRLIDEMDFSTPGTRTVRAKGTLAIHGLAKERIIPCTVVVSPEGARVTARFEVALDDHAIRVPRVVHQKIAPLIQVELDLLFKRDRGT